MKMIASLMERACVYEASITAVMLLFSLLAGCARTDENAVANSEPAGRSIATAPISLEPAAPPGTEVPSRAPITAAAQSPTEGASLPGLSASTKGWLPSLGVPVPSSASPATSGPVSAAAQHLGLGGGFREAKWGMPIKAAVKVLRAKSNRYYLGAIEVRWGKDEGMAELRGSRTIYDAQTSYDGRLCNVLYHPPGSETDQALVGATGVFSALKDRLAEKFGEPSSSGTERRGVDGTGLRDLYAIWSDADSTIRLVVPTESLVVFLSDTGVNTKYGNWRGDGIEVNYESKSCRNAEAERAQRSKVQRDSNKARELNEASQRVRKAAGDF